MSLDTDRHTHEGDTRVCREERDEIEAALDAVEAAREGLREIGRRMFDQLWSQRRDLLDLTDYKARPTPRKFSKDEAREQFADELAKTFNGALSESELERARNIIETGRDE